MRVSKTDVVRARIEPHLKEDAEYILAQLGINTTEAINIFYKMIVIHHGLPFEVKLPNHETLETMRQTDAGENLHKAKSKEDLFKQLKKP
jgi:DNA-damage-inducible protein J